MSPNLPKNNRIYCANWYRNEVMVIDGATNRDLHHYAVGNRPSALAYNEAQNRVYVANHDGFSISVIDGSRP